MAGNQQRPILRSINNRQRSYVRFVNSTGRFVNLYWIDYEGSAISYGVLAPREYIDMDTFVTHPWIFVDARTFDRFLVNRKDVFFPEPQRRIVRVKVYITLPMYTLQELSLRTIRECLKSAPQAFQLEIPRTLQYELAAMLPKTEGESARPGLPENWNHRRPANS